MDKAQQRAEEKRPDNANDPMFMQDQAMFKRIGYAQGWNDHAKEVEGLVAALEQIHTKLSNQGAYREFTAKQIAKSALVNYKKKVNP